MIRFSKKLRVLMMAVLVVMPLFVVAASTPEKSWLTYEPDTVTLKGIVKYDTHDGPPNYGEGPHDKKVKVPVVHLAQPINVKGNSRIWGDAPQATQKASIDAITQAAKGQGLSKSDTALALAMAHTESGFNPDAAAGTTSASGLGQFIDKTGSAYGLTNDAQRFDTTDGANAFISHFSENKALAVKNGYTGQDLDKMVYAYHHDGPSATPTGLGAQIAEDEVLPTAQTYNGALGDGF